MDVNPVRFHRSAHDFFEAGRLLPEGGAWHDPAG